MSTTMSKGKSIMFVIALLFSNIAVMGDTVLYPITYNLYEAFPTQVNAVNYIVSGPLLVITVFSLVASKMMKYMNKKTMLLLGATLFAGSTIFGVLIDSAVYMVITRTICGIGQALVNVSAVALITEVYEDEEKRGYIMGIYNASMGAIGVVISLLSGYLATSGWQNVFKIYWAGIPMIILIILCVPYMKSSQEEEAKVEQTKGQPLGKDFWIMIGSLILFYIAFNIVSFYASVYIAEHNLGDESFAGIGSAMISTGSIICSLLFGFLLSKLKKNTLTLCYIATAIGSALLYFGNTQATTLIAFFLIGGSYGIGFAYSYAQGPMLVPESRIDDAIGIATATYALGGFVSTYVATALMNLLNTEGAITPVFMVLSIVMAILTIVNMVTGNKQDVNATNQDYDLPHNE